MNERALDSVAAERIKWWDAIGALSDQDDPEEGLRLARECRHPDAVWLAALFPAGVAVTRERVAAVMLQQEGDARGIYLAWLLGEGIPRSFLLEAALLGYPVAQGHLAYIANADAKESFFWAEKAAQNGDRFGTFWLADCLWRGRGCTEDVGRALELMKVAAELEYLPAMHYRGELSFGEFDWERYYWWGRAAARGLRGDYFYDAVRRLLPSFEKGEFGRILHTAAPVIRKQLAEHQLPESQSSEVLMASWQCVLELHDAMLGRARRALDCWSLVGLRCGVVKDIRVVIAKMAWEDAWQWGAKPN
jgi:hypothetical protein